MAEESMVIEEVKEKYKDEWVAVRVVERDDVGQPSKVQVIAHSVDRHGLRENVREEQEVCIFYAGPVPKEGYVAIL